jgi:DNA-binding beta-propeller fold protein YncE
MIQAAAFTIALALAACSGAGVPAAPSSSAATTGRPAQPPPGAAADLVARLLAVVDDALRARPDDGVPLYQRAALSVEAGAPADALPFLRRLDAIGWDIPLRPDMFAPLAEDASFRELAARIEARAPRVHRSTVAFSVPEPDLIPEGVAVDPRTRTFYLGSIRKRKVLAIDARGAVSTFVSSGQDGLLGALGVKVDTRADLLWVASHRSSSMAGHASTAGQPDGVFAFSLRDGSLRRRIVFDDGAPHLPNDFAIAPDGTVYLTDSAAGRVLRIPPDRDAFEPVTPPDALVYPNGIARTADGRLYVAHLRGIAIVDPRSRSVTPMSTDAAAPLGGIDGLVLEGGTLLAVQNSLGRPRMVSIALDATGTRATKLTILENDPAVLELPTTACVLDGALYTIANSQLRAFRGGDTPSRPLEPPRILRTPLR